MDAYAIAGSEDAGRRTKSLGHAGHDGEWCEFFCAVDAYGSFLLQQTHGVDGTRAQAQLRDQTSATAAVVVTLRSGLHRRVFRVQSAACMQ